MMYKSAQRPIIAIAIVAGICLLGVIWVRWWPNAAIQAETERFIEAALRHACADRSPGTLEFYDCPRDTIKRCREDYGNMCVTVLLPPLRKR